MAKGALRPASDKEREIGRLLITGANGMVGYAIRQMELPETVFLTHEDLDLTDFQATRSVFQDLNPERVIHLASAVAGISGNIDHPGTLFQRNIMMNTNVLESARCAGVQKLISFMSTCVFPDQCSYPLNEREIHNGPPPPSNAGYAYAKRMLEVQTRTYHEEWGCDFVVAIPTNIYGPNDIFSLKYAHVIPALIHKVFLAKQDGTDLVVWGTGKPLREFIFSQDIAKLSVWALDNYLERSPIIFSPSNEISIRAVVELIVSKLGFNGNVVFDESKPDGQYRRTTDNTKLLKYRPDFSFTPLEEGIETTVNWFLKNYPNVRM